MRESRNQEEERGAHRATGAEGTIVQRYERWGEYLGDLAGEWVTVQFDDGARFDVPAEDMELLMCADQTHRPDGENEGWCGCGGQVQYFDRSWEGGPSGYGCSRSEEMFENKRDRKLGRR